MKLLSLFTFAASAVAASRFEEMERITGVELPKSGAQGLRGDADFTTMKLAWVDAIETLSAQVSGPNTSRRLGWGLCLTFWDCDESTTTYTLERLVDNIQTSQQVDQLQAALRSWTSFDSRFDLYTYILSITNAIEVNNWEAAYPPNGRPNAREHVLVPTSRQDVPDVECGLAYNAQANAVKVPMTDEHFQDVSRANTLLSLGIAENLGFPASADLCGLWNDGENATESIKNRLFGSWPEHRVLVKWGADSMGDRALEELVFYGIGQHRVQRVCTRAANALSLPACVARGEDRQAPENAYYAVYLDFAEGLEVRPGFARLGANAYFDRNGVVLAIRRLGEIYYPHGPQGNVHRPRACTTTWGWKESCSSWWCPSYWGTTETCTPEVPAVYGWLNAKMAFRGTLSAVTTAIDHLYGLHLSVANAIVTANVEELEPNHPLRRLMTPFGYRTEAINYRASFALVNEFGLVHRAFPLTKNGLAALFDFARSSSSGITWATIPERHSAKGVDTLTLPLDEDGDAFYGVIRKMVRAYFQKYYPDPASCAADPGILRWHTRVNSIAPNHDLPALSSCTPLEEILSTFMYLVSAGHRHVGTIAAELEDPCFAPWSWKDADLCGLPRTSYTQILTMALTSHEQPRIMEDYTHMFLDDDARNIWSAFTADLVAFGRDVEARNQVRRRQYTVFKVDEIETSVGI